VALYCIPDYMLFVVVVGMAFGLLAMLLIPCWWAE
jgi:hypothetical protein